MKEGFKMKIITTAKESRGLGCIKGDRKVYEHVRNIEDRGSYWELIIHENRSVRVRKADWKVEKC